MKTKNKLITFITLLSLLLSLTLSYAVTTDPVALDDTANVDEFHSVVVDVLSNDTDADGDYLTISNIVDPPDFGNATIINTPTVMNRPSSPPGPVPAGLKYGSVDKILKFNGIEYWPFDYTNNPWPPKFRLIAYDPDGNIVGDWPNVAGERYTNSISVDNILKTVTFIGQGGYATMTFDQLNIRDQIKYTNTSLNLTDSLVYEVSDGFGGTATATLDITINDITKPWITINGEDVFDGETKHLGYIAKGFEKPYTFKDNLSGYDPSGELEKELLILDIALTEGFDKTYNLDIVDKAGNEASITLEYHVISLEELVALLRPMTEEGEYQRNRTIPVKLSILDEDGNIVPMAADDLSFIINIDGEPAVRTNDLDLPECVFELSEDGTMYKFNLKTKGLDVGSHTMEIFVMDSDGNPGGLVGIVEFDIVGKNK